MVVFMTMGGGGSRGPRSSKRSNRCVNRRGVMKHSFLTKTVSLVALEVYNIKSLCFTSRSFLVCLCDAKKWTINEIFCFHSKTVLLVYAILCDQKLWISCLSILIMSIVQSKKMSRLYLFVIFLWSKPIYNSIYLTHCNILMV